MTKVVFIPNLVPYLATEIENVASQLPITPGQVLSSHGSFLSRLHRNCNVTWVRERHIDPKMASALRSKVKELNLDFFRLNLDLDSPLSIQVVTYPQFGYYRRHKDNGDPAVASRALTLSIQLSGSYDYTGGGLSIWDGKNRIKALKERGSAALFLSGLDHQAHTVWIGERKAAVLWFHEKPPKTNVSGM